MLVALRKESVDRNFGNGDVVNGIASSLSVRRAWIEMLSPPITSISTVSLSVRRAWIEMFIFSSYSVHIWSLSVRRAWIEMTLKPAECAPT